MDKLGNKAMLVLFERIKKSDKALQMALEMTDLYRQRQEVIGKYETYDKTALLKDIKARYRRILDIPPDDKIEDKPDSST